MSINALIEKLQQRAAEIGGDNPVVAWVLEEGVKTSPLTKLAVSNVSPGYCKKQSAAVAVLHLTNP